MSGIKGRETWISPVVVQPGVICARVLLDMAQGYIDLILESLTSITGSTTIGIMSGFANCVAKLNAYI